MPNLQEEAQEQLKYIRQTMERSATFTDVPGKVMVIIGFLAIGVAFFQANTPESWKISWRDTWILAALFSVIIGLWALIRKAKRADHALNVAPTHKFVMSLLPTMAAAAIITLLFTYQRIHDEYHIIWLLLYGAAWISGGATSIRIVSVMGFCFMMLGVLAYFFPKILSMDVWMALGFGGLHLIFGWIIWQKNGG